MQVNIALAESTKKTERCPVIDSRKVKRKPEPSLPKEDTRSPKTGTRYTHRDAHGFQNMPRDENKRGKEPTKTNAVLNHGLSHSSPFPVVSTLMLSN